MSDKTDDSQSSTSPSAGRGRGRGRGYGLDNSPLRKPDSSRNSSRPGALTQPQSPRRNSGSGESKLGYPTNKLDEVSPKTTVSDSSVATSLKTALDVKAPEFVPKVTKSVRSLPTLSVHAQEFVPLQQQQSLPQPSPEHSQLISFLEYILSDLLANPSSYDQSINNITSYLKHALNDNATMELACRVIFHWAVFEPNFSYICARLCEHISLEVQNDFQGKFHQYMLKRCHEEYKQIDELLVKHPQHASSFAVFLAELYSREMFNIDHVLNALFDILELMVQNLNDNLAKPVGQILKMRGASFEDALAAKSETHRLDQLLSTVRAKVSSGSDETLLSSSMSGLLKSVLTLRAANWGRTLSPQPSVPSSPAVSNFNQEPVFYSSSGSHITREQAGYADESADIYENEDLAAAGVSDNALMLNLVNEEFSGARGDFSESEEQTINGDADDLDLDILVVDDDEEMTEEMWAEYERFEAERYQNLKNFDDSGQ